MRPAAAGLPEQGPLPPLGAFRPAVPEAAPSARPPYSSDDFDLPKRRSSLGMWIAVAAVLGGAAALFASPSLRKHAPAEPAEAPRPTASAFGLEKTKETQPPTPTATAVASETAKPAPPEPTATVAQAATASAAATASTPRVDDNGADVDSAALAALSPGQGYLYVASPLTTNVYLYGILAGTTNQRIITKCGPRFIRLGTELGKWQTEGLVQIVKCGALTRVEMGR